MTEPRAHPVPPQVERLKTVGAVAAALGLSACAAGLALDRAQLLRSWLFGFLFWSGIPIGCLSLCFLNHQTGGRWGLVIRRLCEAATRTFPFLALLFLPVAAGLPQIYAWAAPEAAHDELIQAKAAYLNAPAFLARAALYFAIWTFLAALLNRWSLQTDAGPDEAVGRKLRMLSGAGLVVMALSITFMSVDWAMSLDPHWFSTVYGIWFMIGTALSAMTFAVVLLASAANEAPFRGVVETDQFHDLGKLTFAFLMFWAYISFAQFLIVWSANLPEEIPWYLRRFQGGWEYLILAMAALQFALPYALLLSQDVKKSATRLRAVAAWLLLMHAVELYWLIAPDAGPHGHLPAPLRVHWLDFSAWAGIGGLWLLVYAQQLRGRPLLPLGEPAIREALAAAPHAAGGAA